MPDIPVSITAPGYRQLVPLPFPGSSLAWSRRDPLGFLSDAARRFGPVFRHQLGPWVFHLVSQPEHVRHVLQDNYRNYPRSWLYRFARLVGGDGLVTSEGDVWRRQRRMVQPAFHPSRVGPLASLMTRATADMLDRWEGLEKSGEPMDVVTEMAGLTLRIVGKTLLGVELAGETDGVAGGAAVMGPAVVEALKYLDHRFSHLLAPPVWVPTPRNRRFKAAMRTLDRVVYGIIDARRRMGEDTGDLLSMLLAARDEETGEAMTQRELRDQVMTFIGAGHETTAVALAWAVYLLSQHPEVAERMGEEVERALCGRVPGIADVPNLPFTRMVFEETLRLYPPVYAVARDVVADDAIGGFRIPAGSTVILCPYVTHRLPGVWEDPTRFDPDRFSPERSVGRPRFAWFPFLGGPHHCVGNEFATMEATLVLAMIAQRFRLRLAPGARVEIGPMVSLRPRWGVPVIVERLRNATTA
ncbi:MAG TPA: cytochrome P450 [Tepidisphaeraceae bacterium]|jgi:cytochrome P450|nr:cytochrome P450 [Tepidisphaeraceae bacterium]